MVLGEPVQLKASLWGDEKSLGTSSSNGEQTTEWESICAEVQVRMNFQHDRDAFIVVHYDGF